MPDTPPDPLSLRLLRYLPRNLLSRAFGRVARIERPRSLVLRMIRWWIAKFRVNVEESELPPETYPSLLAFFTRGLKAGVRPIDPREDVVVSPVDGTLGQMGKIEGDRAYQAKDVGYSLAALLGAADLARELEGGAFVTLYLAPKDYHRIHAPFDGKVTRVLYEPGTLWPVNPPAVRRIPSLFAVNERVTLWLETSRGPIALALVGATNVGSIRLAFEDFVTNRGESRQARSLAPPVEVKKGDHLATFELGSTVVLLLSKSFALDTMWVGPPARMGRKIATVAATSGR